VSRAELGTDGRAAARVRAEQIAPDDPLAGASGTSLVINFALDILPGLTLTARQPDLQSTAYGLMADFVNAVRGESS
jgi:homoserine dehydrogenase